MERMSANGLFFHRNCFKCSHCNCKLKMGNYSLSKGEGGEKGKFFCSVHYRQLFMSNPEAINYSRADAPKKNKSKTDLKPSATQEKNTELKEGNTDTRQADTRDREVSPEHTHVKTEEVTQIIISESPLVEEEPTSHETPKQNGEVRTSITETETFSEESLEVTGVLPENEESLEDPIIGETYKQRSDVLEEGVITTEEGSQMEGDLLEEEETETTELTGGEPCHQSDDEGEEVTTCSNNVTLDEEVALQVSEPVQQTSTADLMLGTFQPEQQTNLTTGSPQHERQTTASTDLLTKGIRNEQQTDETMAKTVQPEQDTSSTNLTLGTLQPEQQTYLTTGSPQHEQHEQQTSSADLLTTATQETVQPEQDTSTADLSAETREPVSGADVLTQAPQTEQNSSTCAVIEAPQTASSTNIMTYETPSQEKRVMLIQCV